MSKLPSGVEKRGNRLYVDLQQQPQLQHKGGVLSVQSAGVLLVRSKLRIRAFSDVCPHKPKSNNRVRLATGKNQPQAGKKTCLRCKAHNWTWDRKGRPRGKAKQQLLRFRTRRQEDALVVHLTDVEHD